MFGSVHFRKLFLIRFFSYFFIQIGLVTLLLILEPVITEELKFSLNQLTGHKRVLPEIITSTGDSGSQNSDNNQSGSGFGDILTGGAEIIRPVSSEFGIVIEKIGANAQVVPNVDPGSEADYTRALAIGVAHAKGTAFPGDKGNIYLFSHSTDAPWNIVRYNAIFFLLDKLETGDKVVMFYQNRRYDYVVFDKAVVKPTDTHFLTDTYSQSVLTLQTCYPPGTLSDRLIVRARLAGGN
jgi:LPXTG-site transpeptidase (sortase) family protein